MNDNKGMSKAELYNAFAELQRRKYGVFWQELFKYHYCPNKRCFRIMQKVKSKYYCPFHDKEALRIAEYRAGGLRTVKKGHNKDYEGIDYAKQLI